MGPSWGPSGADRTQEVNASTNFLQMSHYNVHNCWNFTFTSHKPFHCWLTKHTHLHASTCFYINELSWRTQLHISWIPSRNYYWRAMFQMYQMKVYSAPLNDSSYLIIFTNRYFASSWGNSMAFTVGLIPFVSKRSVNTKCRRSCHLRN